MKFLLIVLALCLSVICQEQQLSASSNDFDELMLEILEDVANEADENEERGYSEPKQHVQLFNRAPSRLRGCLKCVGEQRSKGNNIKQATKHCNSVCKRQMLGFEEDEDDDDFDQRALKASKNAPLRLRKCIECVGVQRSKGNNVKQATNYCNRTCKREMLEEDGNEEDGDDESFDERAYRAEKQAPAKLRGCIECVGKQRSKGSNVKEATKYCNKVCKREIFDTNDQFITK